MFFANLTWLEFLALFTAAGGLTLALYLLSRARRTLNVSTLRFWTAAAESPQPVRRRRVDQPWSLLLQLLALLLLLLAIAQPRLGRSDDGSFDHVLLLDTSSWMGARAAPGTLSLQARALALRWLRGLPPGDRVMVVRAGALPAPLTRFDAGRSTVEAAIRGAEPGPGALALEDSIEFARRALALRARRPGEIVYVGAARADRASTPAALPPNLRLLLVSAPVENCGLTKMVLRRAPHDPEVWHAFVSARNYGTRARSVPLLVAFGGAPAATTTLALNPGVETTAELSFRTRAAGWVEARLSLNDDLASDDRATLEIPALRRLRVNVYSPAPELLRPLLAADPRVEASFAAPAAYTAEPDADLVVIDGFAPPAPPRRDSLWVQPPAQASPIPVRASGAGVTVERWNSEHPIGAGLRSRDVRLESAMLLAPAAGDIAIAEAAGGALIVARPRKEPGAPQLAVLGFHPLRSAFRYELATPLLFAHLFEWFSPEVFRRHEVLASPAGAVTAALDAAPDPSLVRVLDESGAPLPFTVEGKEVRFFSAAPTTVRVIAAGAERVFSLTLPAVADAAWEPPATVVRGLAAAAAGAPLARELWPWLVLAACLLLVLEWLLFGRALTEQRLRPGGLRRAA